MSNLIIASVSSVEDGVAEVVLDYPGWDGTCVARVVLDGGVFFHLQHPIRAVVSDTIRPEISLEDYNWIVLSGAEVAINAALVEYFKANNEGQKLANMGY